jgi:hypothetical protein
LQPWQLQALVSLMLYIYHHQNLSPFETTVIHMRLGPWLDLYMLGNYVTLHFRSPMTIDKYYFNRKYNIKRNLFINML